MHLLEAEETVHIYYERKKVPQPFVVLPLLCALLCLLGLAGVTLYSAGHPYYERAQLRVPAEALPPQTFTAQVKVVPTGMRTYPATRAHGVLTITNGSVIAQILPAGFTTVSNTGISVVTDRAVFVPAGNANGYGMATVPAHVQIAGTNLGMLAVNSVIGSSLYVRNLSPFTGGRPAYSVTYATAQDKQTAIEKARQRLAVLSAGLHYPCVESINRGVSVTWGCNYVTYHIPAFYHVTEVRIVGKNLLLAVWFVPRPTQVWVK